MPHSKTPSFKNLKPFTQIELVAACLVALAPGDKIFVSGTCVRIAQNLYLTARHVLMDFLENYGYESDGVNFTVWAIHVYEGPEYSMWEMVSFWLSPHSDLAVFRTKPYNDVAGAETVTRSVGLDLAPPSVGSRVVGFGHHNASGLIRVDDKGSKHFEVNTDRAATVGEVQEVHNIQRDSSRLNFPCFRVNARFDGGMSGGPVFNDNGHLCGIICSGLPPTEDGEEHCSYVASLWPLMGMSVDINPNDHNVIEETYPMIELAIRGFIHVWDLEKVSIQPASIPGLYDVTLVGSHDLTVGGE